MRTLLSTVAMSLAVFLPPSSATSSSPAVPDETPVLPGAICIVSTDSAPSAFASAVEGTDVFPGVDWLPMSDWPTSWTGFVDGVPAFSADWQGVSLQTWDLAQTGSAARLQSSAIRDAQAGYFNDSGFSASSDTKSEQRTFLRDQNDSNFVEVTTKQRIGETDDRFIERHQRMVDKYRARGWIAMPPKDWPPT